MRDDRLLSRSWLFLANLLGALAILNYELVTETVKVHSGFGKNYLTGMILVLVPVSAENSGFGRSLFEIQYNLFMQ